MCKMNSFVRFHHDHLSTQNECSCSCTKKDEEDSFDRFLEEILGNDESFILFDDEKTNLRKGAIARASDPFPHPSDMDSRNEFSVSHLNESNEVFTGNEQTMLSTVASSLSFSQTAHPTRTIDVPPTTASSIPSGNDESQGSNVAKQASQSKPSLIKPKRNLTAYNFFFKSEREKTLANSPGSQSQKEAQAFSWKDWLCRNGSYHITALETDDT